MSEGLDQEGLREIWTALGVMEDYLSASSRGDDWGGPKRIRQEPDFEAALSASAERAAVRRAERTAARTGVRAPASGAPEKAQEALSSVGGKGPNAAAGPAGLGALAAEVQACRKCRLGGLRRNPAFGEGVSEPIVLVIGEGPGAEEDAQGRPFVGPAGQLLDRMLAAVDLSRERNCYIANIVKCRPPGNRDPAPDEREACMPYLEAQIAALRPRMLLAMGRVAAQTLLGTTEGISRLRGRWFERGGLPLIATYHPSALLRDESFKRPAWEDLKTLRERLDSAGASGGTGAASAPDAPGAADPADPPDKGGSPNASGLSGDDGLSGAG